MFPRNVRNLVTSNSHSFETNAPQIGTDGAYISAAGYSCRRTYPPIGPAVPDEETLYVASPSMFRNHPLGFIGALLLSPLVIGLVIFLVWYLRARSTELTVTNLRTRLHQGWLSRSITEVWHRDIRNVQLTQTFAQRILGTGRIGISSSGQSGIEIDVSGLRDPDEIKAMIDRYRAEAKSD